MLRGYSWLFAQESFLVVLGDPDGLSTRQVPSPTQYYLSYLYVIWKERKVHKIFPVCLENEEKVSLEDACFWPFFKNQVNHRAII